jgi:hypothetical protein
MIHWSVKLLICFSHSCEKDFQNSFIKSCLWVNNWPRVFKKNRAVQKMFAWRKSVHTSEKIVHF